MLGTDFARTLRAAQGGDSAAFLRLWRDGNVVVVRYLRVVGAPDPYAAARDGWLTVVRGLRTFRGDETAWRVWILACARLSAGGRTAHRGWPATALSTVPGTAHGRTPTGDAPGTGEPADDVEPLVNRGVNDTIAAISELPLGQGEILMLRLVGELPVAAVADVVGTDVVAVHRSEDKAIERLGAERELIAWSLAAPPLALELGGERAAVSAFRSLPRRSPQAAGTTRVIAVGSVRGTAPQTALGRSRTALVGIAALSATMMSLGGLSAAAYMGALPDSIQQVMHQVIGAPAPGATTRGGSVASGSPTGSLATTNAAVGLCRAWTADQAKGVPRAKSAAFGKLADAAGGSAMVDTYCQFATKGQPSSATAIPHPDRTVPGSPTHPVKTKTSKPTRAATGRPSTKPPHSPSTRTSTRNGGPGTVGSPGGRTPTPKAKAPVATSTLSTPKAAAGKAAGAVTSRATSSATSKATSKAAVGSQASGSSRGR
ncbi:hypothetical protein [Nostocoides sp. HKS02]|uniref:hypothetical protein n=1 Tax=Nostocoides sp. HKS02 TaxID=1813880 RepID=UPI0012B501E5|nr:hypothetical protein [Tetrasphaera sp. HKS02]QGN57655.1 hypothetical protein GKE56_06960 [Tetrasphaera sp. HKS02]